MNKMRVEPKSAIYEMNSLYTCESSVNAKPPYNEHFLEGPVVVHYRDVSLYQFLMKFDFPMLVFIFHSLRLEGDVPIAARKLINNDLQ
jgi:hypothetical protein